MMVGEMVVRPHSQMAILIACLNKDYINKVFTTDDVAEVLEERHGFVKNNTRGNIGLYFKYSPRTLVRKQFYIPQEGDHRLVRYFYCFWGKSKLFKKVKLKPVKKNFGRKG